MIVGYVRTTLSPQEISEQQQKIKDCAASKGLGLDIIYSGIDINDLCDNILNSQDILIISDIACLGSSLFSIRDLLAKISAKSITMISVKEGYHYDKDSEYLLEGFDFALNIRTNMTSANTSTAINTRKRKGLNVGMSKGRILRKKLDGSQDKIKQLIKQGKTRNQIAQILGVSPATLYNFIRNHNEINKE